MRISYEVRGDFKKTEQWLKRLSDEDVFRSLERYGDVGVRALAANTPVDTGLTASSWYYEIKKDKSSWSIIWGNTHVVAGSPIAVLLQLGHGTGTGGYVKGRDYINPAMRPIFDKIAQQAWLEVTRG